MEWNKKLHGRCAVLSLSLVEIIGGGIEGDGFPPPFVRMIGSLATSLFLSQEDDPRDTSRTIYPRTPNKERLYCKTCTLGEWGLDYHQRSVALGKEPQWQSPKQRERFKNHRIASFKPLYSNHVP
jgi:hypothetical protein